MVHLSQGQEVLGSSDHFILQRTGLLQDLRLLPTISHHFPSPRPSCPPGAWNLCVCVCVCVRAHAHVHALTCLLSCVQLFATPWTVTCQTPLSIAISFSRRSQPRDRTHVSRVSCIGRQILHCCTTWEALY